MHTKTTSASRRGAVALMTAAIGVFGCTNKTDSGRQVAEDGVDARLLNTPDRCADTTTVDAQSHCPSLKRPLTVFSIGDSIMNYSNKGAYGDLWPAKLLAQGQISTGIDADSGRSLSQPGTKGLDNGIDAVSANAAALANSDAVVTNLGVNGNEGVTDWESQARAFTQAARAIKPEIIVIWITPVAEPKVAPDYVVDRAAARSAVLRALQGEGTIDVVVEWDREALTNPTVFEDDGVHYWSNTRPYVDFASDVVNRIGASGVSTTGKCTFESEP